MGSEKNRRHERSAAVTKVACDAETGTRLILEIEVLERNQLVISLLVILILHGLAFLLLFDFGHSRFGELNLSRKSIAAVPTVLFRPEWFFKSMTISRSIPASQRLRKSFICCH